MIKELLIHDHLPAIMPKLFFPKNELGCRMVGVIICMVSGAKTFSRIYVVVVKGSV